MPIFSKYNIVFIEHLDIVQWFYSSRMVDGQHCLLAVSLIQVLNVWTSIKTSVYIIEPKKKQKKNVQYLTFTDGSESGFFFTVGSLGNPKNKLNF